MDNGPFWTVALVLGGALGGWFLFFLRMRYSPSEFSPNDDMSRAAKRLGLRPARGGAFRGEIDGVPFTVERVAARDGGYGVRVTVTVARPLVGVVRLSGPSDNAGSAQPGAKIRVGDGPFDFAFWVAREEPKGYAGELLMPHDAARAAMLDLPFGTWTFGGRELAYQSYRVGDDVADVVRSVVGVFGALQKK